MLRGPQCGNDIRRLPKRARNLHSFCVQRYLKSSGAGPLLAAALCVAVSNGALAVPDEARSDGPSYTSAANSAKLTPFDIDDETVYPLTPGVTPESVRARSDRSQPPNKSATSEQLPPDYRVNIVNYGRGGGLFIGLASGHLEKDVVLLFTEVNTHRQIKITADVVDYDGNTGYLTATGLPGQPARLSTEDGTFAGSKIVYSIELKSGSVSQATLDTDLFHVTGDVIEAKTDGSYVAHDAMFTSCKHGSLDLKRGVPDYRISASVMTIVPGKYVSAKRVTLYVGKHKTIPLPSFTRNLNTDSPVSSIPTPSYNRNDGLTLHLLGTPESEPHRTFDYDLLLSVLHLPTGYFLFQDDVTRTGSLALPPKGILSSLGDPLNSLLQQFTPLSYRNYAEGRTYEIYPDRVTWYGVLGNSQYIFNRSYTNLSLSRLPEAGIHFGNILGHLPPEGTPEKPVRADQIPYAPALLEAYASFGVLHENPTGVTSGRAFTRVNFATQPFIIGRRLSWRMAATNWLNVYTRGTVYELFAPEVELDYVPTKTSLFNVGYRYLTDAGATPFLSDRRDIRHELRFQYQVGGPYLFGITTKIDLEELRAYDEEISLVRRLDCIQYGVAYHVRSQSFNIIINLLPARRSNADKDKVKP